MKLKMPSYCKDFVCSADKCSDNCCIGWEIDIDEKTARYYKSLDGSFGDTLRGGICWSREPCFKMKGQRCAFLNERNLCDIIIKLGKDSLCQICRDHPRYFRWFSHVKEGGIGLGCEEGARLILSQIKPLSFYICDCDDEGEEDYSPELYELFSFARQEIFSVLENESLPLDIRLSSAFLYGCELQQRADNYIYDKLPLTACDKALKINEEKLILSLFDLEPIDDKWQDTIKQLRESLPRLIGLPLPAKAQGYLKNIAVYFVWRYFSQGVFDEEIVSKLWLMLYGTTVISLMLRLALLRGEDLDITCCSKIAKDLSKQTEYNENNLEIIFNMIYDSSDELFL